MLLFVSSELSPQKPTAEKDTRGTLPALKESTKVRAPGPAAPSRQPFSHCPAARGQHRPAAGGDLSGTRDGLQALSVARREEHGRGTALAARRDQIGCSSPAEAIPEGHWGAGPPRPPGVPAAGGSKREPAAAASTSDMGRTERAGGQRGAEGGSPP